MKLKGDIFMDWRNLGRPCHIDGGGRGLLESLYYEMGSTALESSGAGQGMGSSFQ